MVSSGMGYRSDESSVMRTMQKKEGARTCMDQHSVQGIFCLRVLEEI